MLCALGLLLVLLQLIVIHGRPEWPGDGARRALERVDGELPDILIAWRSPALQVLLVVGGACLALGLGFFGVHGRGRYPDAFTRRLVAACGALGATLLLASQLLVESTYALGLGLSPRSFELPLRVALIGFAVGSGALALRPRGGLSKALAALGLVSTVALLLIPRAAGWVQYDLHRIIQQRQRYQTAAMLEHDQRAIPAARMVDSLAPREAARQELVQRTHHPRALLSLPFLRPYAEGTARHLAWQRFRIFAILAAVLLGVPLLAFALWSRRELRWRLPLGAAALAATVGALGLYSYGSPLPAWHHVIVGIILLPAVLQLSVTLAGAQGEAHSSRVTRAGRERSVSRVS
jgi:hypothetical protein